MPERRSGSSAAVPPARLALAGLCVASSLVYLGWRTTSLNPDALALSLLFLFTEALGILWTTVFVLSNLRFPRRQPRPAPPGLAVDILVPSYNEPVEIVRRTLIAALRVRYPHRTVLLDDGNRPQMRALAAELGCAYLARASNVDAKAGNLNNGLRHSTAEFVALFDADHLPVPDFLDRTLGWFDDPRVAFVQTPQEFYNPYSYTHWRADADDSQWNEHSLFYRVIQRGRDAYDSAMFCGCAAVLRRAALDEIGGFATGTVTEDMHTSVRLHECGWRSVMHPETLSAGLAPPDAWHFCRQRLRWAQGALQVVIQERLWRRRGLTRAQQLSYLVHAGVHLEGIRVLLVFFLPALALVAGVVPMHCTVGEYLAVFLPYFVLSLLAYADLGRGHGLFYRSEVFNLARCVSSTRAVLAMGRRRIPFWVTPKTASDDPRHYRLLLPWLVVGVDLAAIGIGAWRYAHGTAGELAPLLVVCMWAVLGMSVALGLIVHTRRSAASRGRGILLPVRRMARLHGGHMRMPVLVLCADERRAVLAAAPTPPEPITLELELGDREHRVLATPAGAEWHLSWSSREAQDEWEYALHQFRIGCIARHDRTADRGVLESLRRPAWPARHGSDVVTSTEA